MTSRPRITILTPNPAIDVTYEVPEPALGCTNRVTAVSRRAGGKGLNVAAVLSRLGVTCRVTGPLGGPAGQELRELLPGGGHSGRGHHDGAAVVPAWVDLPRLTTRTTVTVIARDGTATGLYEPGPALEQADWEALTRATLRDLSAGDVLAVCGSCPPGTSAEQLTALLSAARRRGARTIVDTSGPLLAAAATVCDVVTPNREELLQATGARSLHEGARALLGLGAGAVVASDGPRGMLLLASGGHDPHPWYAPAPSVEVVNPTGAGDSAVAALAAELLIHPPPSDGPVLGPRALAAAVALSASAVTTPVAGAVDLRLSNQLLSQIKVVPAHGTD